MIMSCEATRDPSGVLLAAFLHAQFSKIAVFLFNMNVQFLDSATRSSLHAKTVKPSAKVKPSSAGLV